MMTVTELELKELKDLVNQFMNAIYDIPLVDCDQKLVEELWMKLADAVNDPNNDVKRTLQ